MRVGIIGLGLIGGSMAKAYHRDHKWKVFGANRSHAVVEQALEEKAIHAELTDNIIPTLDLLFLAAYPQAVIDHLHRIGPLVSKNCIVIDLSGIKQRVCDEGFKVAREYGFTFIGGHPMAGTHNSGFAYSREDMYDGAPMVLVPPVFDDPDLIDRVNALLLPARFGRITPITAEEHDRRIAFTSQLPHIVSNAFIKSPTSRAHDGFSAGSYRDLTRVAWLNPEMWTELFMENREPLLYELDTFIESIRKYREALAAGDSETMKALLAEGRKIKEEVDGH